MQCFIISPFGGEFDGLFRDVLKPKLEAEGFEVIRADTSDNSVNILKDIIHGISRAEFIIADLTGLNANVMYELGLAHGLQKAVVILTQNIDTLPFDLKAYRAHPYTLHYQEIRGLEQYISEVGRKYKLGEIEFGSPVSDFLTVASDLPAGDHPSKDGIYSFEGEEGFLEKVLAFDQAIAELLIALEGFGSDMDELTQAVNPSTVALEQIMSSNLADHLKATESLKQAKLISVILVTFSENVRRRRLAIEKNWSIIEDYGDFSIKILENINIPDDKLIENAQAYVNLSSISSTAIGAVEEFRDSFKSLSLMSSDLSRASKDAVHALNPIIDQMQIIKASSARFGEVFKEVALNRGVVIPQFGLDELHQEASAGDLPTALAENPRYSETQESPKPRSSKSRNSKR